HIVLPCPSPQHHLEGRQQRHEHRHSLASAHLLQPSTHLLLYPHLHLPSPMTRHRRPSSIHRQCQLRRSFQLAPPVPQLLGQHLPFHPSPLPYRIIGVLHSQLL